ncbi:MAG: M12 family metallopeptidase [Bacteroidota bacterium]
MKTKILILCCLFATTLFGQDETYRPNVKGVQKTYQIKLPNTEKAQAVRVDVKNNLIIMEGDMILGRLVEFEGQGSVAIDGADKRWPDGIIPYTIAANHPKRTDILAAIDMINNNTVLCVRPRSGDANYINFVSGSGCASWVGKQGGAQEITIGSCSVGSIAHEMIHAAGMYHEQSREDRDGFITINFANITAGKEHNFDKHVSDATDIGPYNYGSIMHYGATAFSKNGNNTITVKVPPGTATTVIGQRTSISTGDKNGLKQIYPTATGCNCNTLVEDCISMNHTSLEVKRINNRWKVVSGNIWYYDTDQSKAEADMILKIIKQYQTNKLCFVGRPGAPMHYITKNNLSPVGAVAGEDCINFNLNNLTVKKVGANWTVVDGNHLMFAFGSKELEARKALCVIKKYGFTKACYVGRPGPSMIYLRK